jgi:SHS2 domain-containing protein
MGYEFLEHTADVYVKAWGDSLEEAFAAAAKAMMEVITDTGKVEPEQDFEVSLEAGDLESLLYLWLEEVIFMVDAEGLLFSGFQVSEVTGGEEALLSATLSGEEFDSARHEQRQAVKAVTYHMMEITEEDDRHVVKFVLDV